jgi:hypothetical protein
MIALHLERIRARMAAAAAAAGRDPAAVRLVAVTKTVPPAAIREAVRAGVTIVGESYLQETRGKHPQLSDLPLEWHLVGHLQRNKARQAVELFSLIHSLDSLPLALALNGQAKRMGKRQRVLLQVNIGAEGNKSGVDPREACRLAGEIAALPHLRLEGLMALPPFFDDPQRARPFFAALRTLRDALRVSLPGLALAELSMGMSGDFEAAIAEGATLVRVGSAIFGART